MLYISNNLILIVILDIYGTGTTGKINRGRTLQHPILYASPPSNHSQPYEADSFISIVPKRKLRLMGRTCAGSRMLEIIIAGSQDKPY